MNSPFTSAGRNRVADWEIDLGLVIARALSVMALAVLGWFTCGTGAAIGTVVLVLVAIGVAFCASIVELARLAFLGLLVAAFITEWVWAGSPRLQPWEAEPTWAGGPIGPGWGQP